MVMQSECNSPFLLNPSKLYKLTIVQRVTKLKNGTQNELVKFSLPVSSDADAEHSLKVSDLF